MSADPESNGALPAGPAARHLPAHSAPPPRALPGSGEHRRHVLVAIVLNKPGVLNRVASLMRARNFNIESLAVSHTDQRGHQPDDDHPPRRRRRRRAGRQAALPAHRRAQGPGRHDEPTVQHELALVKVRATDRTRGEILRFVELSRGRVVDLADGSVIVEVTGTEIRGRRVRRAPPQLRHQGDGPHRDRRDVAGLRIHRGGDQAMTATMYYDNDADPAALAGQTVAIIGYGSQGHAHALNLHESGVDVIVGLAAGVEEPRARRGGRPAGHRRRRRGQGRATSS